MNKKIGIIVFILGIIIIISGIVIFLNYDKNNELDSKEKLDKNNSTESQKINNWETDLTIRADEIIEEVFNGNYTYDANEEFNITLYDLQIIYNKDLSEFNTDMITCDLQKSTIKVIKENDGYTKQIYLSCTI